MGGWRCTRWAGSCATFGWSRASRLIGARAGCTPSRWDHSRLREAAAAAVVSRCCGWRLSSWCLTVSARPSRSSGQPTAAAPTRGGRPWAGRRSRMRSRRPIHPRAPGGPYQRPSRTRTFVGWCRAARWKLRSATNGRASASRRPGCPPAAAASDVVTATAGTRRCGWRIGARRRPTRGGATTALYAALRAELVAFEFAFRRPPACDGRVKTAFHGAFRKFRIVVDVHLSAEAAEPPHEPPPPPTTQPTTAGARLPTCRRRVRYHRVVIGVCTPRAERGAAMRHLPRPAARH